MLESSQVIEDLTKQSSEVVLLVKKQDDGRVREPFVVADAVEELQRLVHAVLQQSGGEVSEACVAPGP